MGCGNDFIVIDNQSGQIQDLQKGLLAKDLCRRKRSLGADGMIFVEKSQNADARMDFFNSDGSRSEMCGNGLRCFARFVTEAGITPDLVQVETDAGLYVAQVGAQSVRLVMPPVSLPRRNITLAGLPQLHSITVGVPHAVIFDDTSWEWPEAKLVNMGRNARNHSYFPNGTNVNFVRQEGKKLKVRTYERGVEDETLACGTGVTASALTASIVLEGLQSPISVETQGGPLEVGYQRSRDGFIDVWLQGEAVIVAQGFVNSEALDA